MSELKPLQLSSPGKVFILGEYAVLADLPAVVAAVAPRFEAEVVWGGGAPANGAVSGSPLDRLQKWVSEKGLIHPSFSLKNPYPGGGGFGASTAEFAMGYLSYINSNQDASNAGRRWKDVWSLYRELTFDGPLSPSGADLVAQWQGGVVFFDPSDGYCMDVWPIFDWSSLLVFSAAGLENRKVPTHSHLKALSEKGGLQKQGPLFSQLEKVLLEGISAVRENEPMQLGRAMDEYAQVLATNGLECAAAREDRLALRDLPDVLGVKGAGALLSDAVLVLMRPRSLMRARVISVAESRGLTLISDGLTCQMGVTCQT